MNPAPLVIDLPEWVAEVLGPEDTWTTDEQKMALVVRLARENVLRETGGPFGAAVFESESGALAGIGVNSVVRLRGSVLHAEILALLTAQRRAGSHTLRAAGLPAHELFTSCEPCAMCLGAILWSGVRRVVHAASRDDAMRVGFEEGPVFPESLRYLESRGIAFRRGVLAEEAREVLDLYRRRGGPIYNG